MGVVEFVYVIVVVVGGGTVGFWCLRIGFLKFVG